ncbi:hypothetical protein JCM8097_003819 [Rhodosporidiobolus ruineniae]
MNGTTRIIPASRRFLATTPTGRPVATSSSNIPLGAQTAAGYGGTSGPIPQAAGGPGGKPPKKSNVGLIVGALALVGGSAAYYLTQEDHPAEAAKDDLHKLEAGANHEIDKFRTGARSTSEPLGPQPGAGAREAERYADSLRSPDNRYGAEQVKDALKSDARGVEREAHAWGSALKSDEKAAWKGAKDEVSRWGDALHDSAAQEKAAFAGVRDEVHRWGDALSSGPRERDAWRPAIDEVRRYRDLLRGREAGAVEHVENWFRQHGVASHNVVEGGNPWLDWIGGGKGVRRRAAEQKISNLERDTSYYAHSAADALKAEYESAKSSLSSAAHDAKKQANSWFSWGEKKAEDVKDRAAADYNAAKAKTKEEASSWSSWTSAKASDAQSAVSSAASSVEGAAKGAYNQAASATNSAYIATANAAQNAGEKVKEEGSSWWNWSGEKAGEAKDGLKEGLLKAEQGVEHGAQKAQYETKKL